MVIVPCNKSRIVSDVFLTLSCVASPCSLCQNFGTWAILFISNQYEDDSDVAHEIRCMYTRVNMLIRKFHKCSSVVKIRLFRAYCKGGRTMARAKREPNNRGLGWRPQRGPGAELLVVGQEKTPKLKAFCPFPYKRGAKSSGLK